MFLFNHDVGNRSMRASSVVFVGMLKKVASGVLASLPCSRTRCTLRASNWLRPCWTDFFEHSRQLLISVLPQALMCNLREIFNTPQAYV